MRRDLFLVMNLVIWNHLKRYAIVVESLLDISWTKHTDGCVVNSRLCFNPIIWLQVQSEVDEIQCGEENDMALDQNNGFKRLSLSNVLFSGRV